MLCYVILFASRYDMMAYRFEIHNKFPYNAAICIKIFYKK